MDINAFMWEDELIPQSFLLVRNSQAYFTFAFKIILLWSTQEQTFKWQLSTEQQGMNASHKVKLWDKIV